MRTRVVTVGNFDGVHLGHAELLARARSMADRLGAGVTAVVFDPHPMTVLRPDLALSTLTPFDARAAELRRLGADTVERLEPTRALLATEPEVFIRELRDRLGLVGMVEGPDFRFGKHRAGDAATLRSLADELGFELDLVLTPIEVSLDDQSIVRASSTITRWLLANGRVRDAARVLGRPYRLSGEVVPGDRRGRTIGFPTANLRTGSLLPADGVYACIARLNTGVPGEGSDTQICPAAVNIGSRPTFDGVERRVEAHLILDGHGSTTWAPVPGQPEYGWSLTLDFVGWVRDQVKFDGIDALRGQLRRDVDRVRMIAGAFGKTPGVHATIRPAQNPGAR